MIVRMNMNMNMNMKMAVKTLPSRSRFVDTDAGEEMRKWLDVTVTRFGMSSWYVSVDQNQRRP